MRPLVFLSLCLPFCLSWHFPGYRKFTKIVNKNILNGVVKNALEQNMFGNGTQKFSMEKICARLSELHNENLSPETTKKNNRKFLKLSNPMANWGYYAISAKGCLDSLRDPKYHKYSDWLSEYSGFHVGKWYDSEGAKEDTVQWYAVDRKYFQSIHHLSRCEQKRCDCNKKDPKNNNDCSWAWNYPGKDMSMPYTYHWDPENAKSGKGQKGVFVGFSYKLRNVGFAKAECLIWLGTEKSCLQCFTRYTKPFRATLACYDGLGQYEILDERPKPPKKQLKGGKNV